MPILKRPPLPTELNSVKIGLATIWWLRSPRSWQNCTGYLTELNKIKNTRALPCQWIHPLECQWHRVRFGIDFGNTLFALWPTVLARTAAVRCCRDDKPGTAKMPVEKRLNISSILNTRLRCGSCRSFFKLSIIEVTEWIHAMHWWFTVFSVSRF